MDKLIKDHVIYFKFPHFKVPHGFTTKHGGVSTGDAAHMNVDASKEPVAHIKENFIILGHAIGFDPASLTGLQQTHTARVEIVDKRHLGNKLHKPDKLGGCDGMVTKDPQLTLLTMHADCPPLYFYDPMAQVIGLSHAGWRGTVGGIARETIKKMETLGSNPKDILAGIGPGVGYCCFQVDEPVMRAFQSAFSWADEYIQPDEPGKYKIDLLAVNKRLMLVQGLQEPHIWAKQICTKCNHQLFHSHRVTGKARGNMGAILTLSQGNTE